MAVNLAQWQSSASGALLALRNSDGGWPYGRQAASSSEPTALAVLALADMGVSDQILQAAGSWLAARQATDGMIATSATCTDGIWVTPLAALALRRLGQTDAADAAAQGLLNASVFTFTQSPPGAYGYDTTLAGWPWSPGAFSFAEPTALAVLFLKISGYGQHRRVREAVNLLRNRALAAGGWNYGEPEVLGGALFPAEAPTAEALLALTDEPDNSSVAGLTWLLGRAGQISSLYSLGWTAAALNVLGVSSSQWQEDVASRWNELPAERRDAVGTSLCLLGVRSAVGHPFGLA